MQITHAEAIRLIQYQADGVVRSETEKELHRHLADCTGCRAYAQEFHEMENILQSVMRKQWTLRPAPLSLDNLRAANNEWKNKRTLLVTRTSLISFAFLAFAFIGWQFALTSTSILTVSQPVSPPIPHPPPYLRRRFTPSPIAVRPCTMCRRAIRSKRSRNNSQRQKRLSWNRIN